MSKRVAILMHVDLIPPEPLPKKFDREKVLWITEHDVINAIQALGHEVRVMGVHDELTPIRETLTEFKPHVTFNLLEEFNSRAIFDQHVVSYLELLQVPYTGCNPRGLTLARDKSIAKKILSFHKIKTPEFYDFPRNKKITVPRHLNYPYIVKCQFEEASLGIAQASVVTSPEKMRERIEFIHEKFGVDAIAERFIEGKEIYVGVLGNYNLQVFHPWSLHFDKVEDTEKQFYTSKAKFDPAYRKRKGIRTAKSKLDPSVVNHLQAISKRAYRALCLNGYARMDFRLTVEGQIYLLEANPNPDIALDDDFAASAYEYGYTYEELIGKLLSLGQSWASYHDED